MGSSSKLVQDNRVSIEANDNSNESFYIVDASEGCKFVLELSVIKRVSREINTYKIIILNNGDLLNVSYEFNNNEIEGIVFNSELISGKINLIVESLNVGENLDIKGTVKAY